MAHVPAAPRPLRTYDGDRAEILAEQARLAREKPPHQPGTVQSTDGSVIRIPGPLDDVGRDGHALVYDEDLHQPVWRAAASGGIVGQAQIVATAGSVEWLSGNIAMTYGGVTYGTPTDPNAGGGGESSVAVSSWVTVTDHLITLSPGWYIPVCYQRIIWDDPADSPDAFRGPYMGGGADSAHNDMGIHAATPYSGGRRGFVMPANYGPTYMADGFDLHAECRADGGNPTGDSNPAQSAIVWTITKLT